MDGDPPENEGRGGLVYRCVPGPVPEPNVPELSRYQAEKHPPRSGLIPDRGAVRGLTV